MQYLAIGNEFEDAPEVPSYDKGQPVEIIETVGERKGIIAILKANKLKLQTYAKEKEKTLLQDIFSTATGVKMLKKDVDHVAELLEKHSLTFTGGHMSLELKNDTSFETIKRLKEIKDAKLNDKYLSSDSYFTASWNNFLFKQLTVFVTAISQKMGLVLREKDDYVKYSDGCFLKFDKGFYTLIVWW